MIFFIKLLTLYYKFLSSRNMSTSSSRAFSGDECLIDSGSTNTILQHTKFFSELLPTQKPVGTISGVSNIIEGSGIAHITLSSQKLVSKDFRLYKINRF